MLKRVLAAFDDLHCSTIELAALLERAAPASAGHSPAERDAARAALVELVRKGWLRSAGGPDRFTRTEAGRLALAEPCDVTLYTRPGCHLCEEAKAQTAPLLREFGARLREINIDADPELRERYDEEVPVVFLGSRKVAKHRVDLRQFRRQLEQARKGVVGQFGRRRGSTGL